jgi:hypothetical protein
MRAKQMLAPVWALAQLATLSAFGQSVDFTISDFTMSSWQVSASNGPRSNSWVEGVTNNGNPGSCLAVGALSDSFSGPIVLTTYLYTPYTYDPSAQGRIFNIRLTMDTRVTTQNTAAGFGLVIKQGGTVFVTWPPAPRPYTSSAFGSIDVQASGSGGISLEVRSFRSPSARVDYACGQPIQLGVYISTAGLGSLQATANVDNVRLRIYPDSGCASPFVYSGGSVLAESGTQAMLTAEVVNLCGGTARWHRDGVPLPLNDPRFVGVSAASLTVQPVTSADSGAYTLSVANGCSSALGSAVQLRVLQPSPVCAADFNFSGSLSVQDIYDFLAAYFAGCP